jgi:hydroxyacylglutathione hydrolase
MSEAKDEVSSWSVKKLKQFLSERNVDFSKCIEKSEFIALAIEHFDSDPIPLKNDGNSMGDLIWETIPVGPLSCNMTIIADKNTNRALLIDPGGNSDEIIALVTKMKVEIVEIIITHGHFDHFLSAGDLKAKYPEARLRIHSEDIQLYNMLPFQLQLFGIKSGKPVESVSPIDSELADGQELPVGEGKVIHTPGHTPGSCCFYFAQAKLLFSGDTLFRRSIGRTDLPGGGKGFAFQFCFANSEAFFVFR